ncbi:MAG: zinc ribbon domain-containing protein [Akkermansiaceae bacterium]
MKTCKFCAEEIQDEAIKCKHCGEFLELPASNSELASPPPIRPVVESSIPWYFRKAFVIIMLLSIGPLALPLVWFHPKTSVVTKSLITVLVGILTYGLYLMTVFAYKLLMEQLEAIQALGI